MAANVVVDAGFLVALLVVRDSTTGGRIGKPTVTRHLG
jgi:hypothetical protein